jgi:uncharacterized protein YdbL (DUF1318 family)
MSNFNRRSITIASVLSIFVLVSSAFALSLDEAKRQGLVGETPGGYLGLVQAGNAEAAKVMADINQQRRQKYAEIAAKNGTALAAVEGLAGKRAIEATSSGNFIQTQEGVWRRK